MAGALTEPARFLTALHAASYMRWVETRKGRTPAANEIQLYVRGLLDSQGFSYEADDPRTIEILALTINFDVVHSFIENNGIFDKLDRAAKSSN
jgi:hypothetical protein